MMGTADERARLMRIRDAAQELLHADNQYGLRVEREVEEALNRLQAALNADTEARLGIAIHQQGRRP